MSEVPLYLTPSKSPIPAEFHKFLGRKPPYEVSGVRDEGLDLGFEVKVLGFGVSGFGFRVESVGIRVEGRGLRVEC